MCCHQDPDLGWIKEKKDYHYTRLYQVFYDSHHCYKTAITKKTVTEFQSRVLDLHWHICLSPKNALKMA